MHLCETENAVMNHLSVKLHIHRNRIWKFKHRKTHKKSILATNLTPIRATFLVRHTSDLCVVCVYVIRAENGCNNFNYLQGLNAKTNGNWSSYNIDRKLCNVHLFSCQLMLVAMKCSNESKKNWLIIKSNSLSNSVNFLFVNRHNCNWKALTQKRF